MEFQLESNSKKLSLESARKDSNAESNHREQILKTDIPSKTLNENAKVSIPKNPQEYRTEDNMTIFGKPLTEIDPDLKICSNCSSKIKKMWSICPICGKPT